MTIIEVSTGKKLPIQIVPVEMADYKSLVKSRYFFDWETEKNEEVYKSSSVQESFAVSECINTKSQQPLN